MNQPLIFTEQRVIPKLLDALMTLIAWIGFSYLIYNGLMNALSHSTFTDIRPFFTTLNTVTFYAGIALINGLMLIIWAKYNQHRFSGPERRSRRPGLEDSELTASFRITPSLAVELNKGRILTVFHQESGEIEHVEVSKGIADNLLPAPTQSWSLAMDQRKPIMV